MGSFYKDCGCARPTRCPHPYTIRFRDALGKQREEAGYGTQDAAIERLTQIYAEKKRTAPSIAEARRALGQQTIAEYARQWLPRQRRMTEYSTGEHVNSSISVHIVPRLGSRKLNTVTPIVVERSHRDLSAGSRPRRTVRLHPPCSPALQPCVRRRAGGEGRRAGPVARPRSHPGWRWGCLARARRVGRQRRLLPATAARTTSSDTPHRGLRRSAMR
nr:hypothetical protein [Streptomyces poonensis]